MLMYFVNEDHIARFNEIRNKLPEEYFNSKVYLSVIYVGTSSDELYRKVLPYFDFEKYHFRFTEMFEQQDFSGGLRIMADLCVLLYNQGAEVDVSELGRLDEKNFEVALQVIKFRYRSSRPPYHFDAYTE